MLCQFELWCLFSEISLKDLQDELFRQTGVVSSNQLLLFENHSVKDNMANETGLWGSLRTTLKNPLILLDLKRAGIDDRISGTLQGESALGAQTF